MQQSPRHSECLWRESRRACSEVCCHYQIWYQRRITWNSLRGGGGATSCWIHGNPHWNIPPNDILLAGHTHSQVCGDQSGTRLDLSERRAWQVLRLLNGGGAAKDISGAVWGSYDLHQAGHRHQHSGIPKGNLLVHLEIFLTSGVCFYNLWNFFF